MAGLFPSQTLDLVSTMLFYMLRYIALISCLCMMLSAEAQADKPQITLHQDDEAGQLYVCIDRRKAFSYQYIPWLDLPHYWPMYSPSGKNLLVQQSDPYPHHRSFWFADTVRLDRGREVSTYNSLYSGQWIGQGTFGPPYRDHIRHIDFTCLKEEGDRAVIDAILVWEMDGDQPVMQEERNLVVHALDNGEYLIDIIFKLTAAYGNVEFVSDEVHYAWPYLRMHPQFSGENGGIITTDNGATGQKDSNMKIARWIDYSNTIDGVTEGLAVFQWRDGEPHRWLTREYGCFGPRRPENLRGKSFILKKGESITQRVGILVHRGNIKSGRVNERYQQYIESKWE
jgi:hypothetical protein